MKRILLAIGAALCLIGLIGWWNSSQAQQQSDDPRIVPYRQLLTDANDRVATAMGQINTLALENAQLKAELAKLKAEKPAAEKKD